MDGIEGITARIPTSPGDAVRASIKCAVSTNRNPNTISVVDGIEVITPGTSAGPGGAVSASVDRGRANRNPGAIGIVDIKKGITPGTSAGPRSTIDASIKCAIITNCNKGIVFVDDTIENTFCIGTLFDPCWGYFYPFPTRISTTQHCPNSINNNPLVIIISNMIDTCDVRFVTSICLLRPRNAVAAT